MFTTSLAQIPSANCVQKLQPDFNCERLNVLSRTFRNHNGNHHVRMPNYHIAWCTFAEIRVWFVQFNESKNFQVRTNCRDIPMVQSLKTSIRAQLSASGEKYQTKNFRAKVHSFCVFAFFSSGFQCFGFFFEYTPIHFRAWTTVVVLTLGQNAGKAWNKKTHTAKLFVAIIWMQFKWKAGVPFFSSFSWILVGVDLIMFWHRFGWFRFSLARFGAFPWILAVSLRHCHCSLI